jgi:Beta-propeller repeat
MQQIAFSASLMKYFRIVFLGMAYLLVTLESHSQAPTLEWAKGVGGTSSTFGASIGIDALKNVYTTGQFNGTTDFNPGTGTFSLPSAGGSDIFISKLDANGNFVWANRIGSAGADYGYAIAVDGSGNQYITGAFNGTVDFNPGAGTANLTSGGVADIFILKLDAAGIFQWAQKIGSTGADEGNSITIDPSGDILLTGLFTGTVDFDPSAVGTTNLVSLGNNDIFITKFNASGNFVWAKGIGNTGFDRGNSIKTDLSGNVYTTGTFVGTVDFDPGAATTI